MKSTVVLLVVIFGLSQSDSAEPKVYRIETGTNDCKPCDELSFPCESEHSGPAGSRHFCLCKSAHERPLATFWGNEAAKTCHSSVLGPCGESSNGAFKVGCGDKFGIDPGLICKDKRCVSKIGLNSLCFGTKDCQDGLICNKKTRRCVKPKSLKHTDFCSADEECEKGLRCLSVEFYNNDTPEELRQCCAKIGGTVEEPSEYNRYLQSDVMKAGDVRRHRDGGNGYERGPLRHCCKNEDCTETKNDSRSLEPIPIIMVLSILHIIE